MAGPQNIDHRITELLVHLGCICKTGDARSDLTAVQWTCLRFFARANASTRTASAFASFQSTTRGTASQVIKALEGRGLIVRRPSARDGRSSRFDLTEAGRLLLSRDPLADINNLLGLIDLAERRAFLATLSRLSSSLAALKNTPDFGTCRDCSHFTASQGSGFCTCLTAALGSDEIDMLCASYCRPADPSRRPQTERQPNDTA